MRIAIPRNSRLEKLAAERLWDIMGSPDADIRTLTQEQIRSRRDMMGRIDFSQGFQLALYSNGNPACRVPFKNSDMGLVY
jgi:hypothetical protein